jgi:peptidyl-prolyl cis-trans isomerase A (cyclophilin A)
MMIRSLGGAFIILFSLQFSAGAAMGQALPRVILQTQFGDIEVEVDTVRAPMTGTNFLRYVDLGFYQGGRFHRIVRPDNQPGKAIKIEVIQGGIDSVKTPNFPPIELERTNVTKLRHLDGTISMARSRPNSATSHFFICIGDQPELDYGGRRNSDGQGFAAFGRVTRGMGVVRKIQTAPADGQILTPAVRIRNIVRQRQPDSVP